MRTALFALAALCAQPADAADLIVNAAGGDGYQTIDAAMAVAQPNDRLLVMPGHYPAYQHTVAVDVIGVAADPSFVKIDRVDYHVSIPTIGYDTLISNVTIGSKDVADGTAISGNELPPGTLHLDGVVVDGAVFLGGGATGFSLLVTNSRIANEAGEGFLGAAFHVGGANNFVQFRNSKIVAADAAGPFAASHAMRISSGTTVWFADAVIQGGKGSAVAGSPNGATALVRGLVPGTVRLRLDGASVIAGGDGEAHGAGGHAIDVSGTIDLGAATVTGGSGSPAGAAYADAIAIPMAVDLHLGLLPVMKNAEGPIALHIGDSIGLSMNTPAASSAIAIGVDIDMPSQAYFLSLNLSTALFIPGNTVVLGIPSAPPITGHGFEIYAQGFTRNPANGGVLLSDTASVRLDLIP